MSWSHETSPVQVGDDVYGSDQEKVGTVAEVQPSYIVVEKGFFFPTDYYIPVNAITQVMDGQVVLNVSKDTALHSGWETVPGTTGDAIMTGDRGWDLASEVTATDRVLGEDTGGINADAPRMAGYEATSEDELVIPLREEELTASVRETEAGAARIQKRVVAEDRVLEVPVTEEQIRVERRVVDRAADATDADAFEEIVIEVPLTQQEVELRKQARVAEEVVVTKDAVQHTEQVRGTVRREEVDVIDDAGTTGLINESDSRA
jgi:uncharacterized protein (TIGR02271 family)